MFTAKFKIVSSLEKALVHESIDKFKPLRRITALKGERLSFQMLHTCHSDDPNNRGVIRSQVTMEGELAKYATMRDVCSVPIDRHTTQCATIHDDNYISKEPGVFPDILRPMHYGNSICIANGGLMAVWVEVNIPKRIKAGDYTITINIHDHKGNFIGTASTVIEIINAVLPDDEIYYTEWLHCDCLASYYNVKMWSKRHWEIIENFMKVAVKNGINMVLTPLLTPPLDTAPGGERPTTQLVKISVDGGKYSFDFTLLDKWVKLCDKVGFKYFEMNHLFTQWGSAHAPKVMATVDGEYKKIFGWETDSTGDEYLGFLRELLSAVIEHMKKSGNDKRCFFHISDEPNEKHLETYKKAKCGIADVLKGYPIMDALSHIEYYLDGTCEMPIPSNSRVAPFIEAKVPNLWTYYCCSQASKVSNRFIAMPACRNRSIGYQMYKYDIKGFLQWGYNFYYNYFSCDLINPYVQLDGNAWVPPGDAFSVYPNMDGTALESSRIIVFFEALQDMKAMKLCEKYYGKEAIVKIIDEVIGCDVTFDDCATYAEQILEIREKVNALIKKAKR